MFDTEPLPLDDSLRQLPKVLLPTHLGFGNELVHQRFAEGVTECLEVWLAGKPLLRVVGKPV